MTCRPFLLSLAVFLLACAGAASPLRGTDGSFDTQVAQATLVKTRQQAPDFTCQTLDGRSFSLSAKKGKVVVLFFFAASVGSYAVHLQQLEQGIVQKLRDRDDFEFLALGRGHTREEVVQISGKNRLMLPLAADPEATIFNRYFTKFVPRIVVVARDGTIASMLNGYRELTGVVELQHILGGELARPR